MVAIVGVRYIVAIVKSVLFIILIDAFVIKLLEVYQVSRNAATGASMGDSLAEPRALAYASRTAYVSHA